MLQSLYTKCIDNRVLRVGPVTWDMFERAFLDWFFPRELRKAKVEEFINLHQGAMSVLNHSLMFTQLS